MRSLELGLASRNARRECEKRDENCFSSRNPVLARNARNNPNLKTLYFGGLVREFLVSQVARREILVSRQVLRDETRPSSSIFPIFAVYGTYNPNIFCGLARNLALAGLRDETRILARISRLATLRDEKCSSLEKC